MADAVRFRQIDDSNRRDHTRIEPSDQISFLHEYTSQTSWKFSTTNGLISNLKKAARDTRLAKYKTGAIALCARQMRDALSAEWLRTGTLVPMPPSKGIDHEDYDNRIERLCRIISPGATRCLLKQEGSYAAFHSGDHRVGVEELASRYTIDRSLVSPAPTSIAIVDDVLSAGTHFKAAQLILTRRFPDASIFGLFVARRVFPPEESAADVFDIFS